MRTLIYKRTHCGDPDPETGVFGNQDCMKTVRGRRFDAVIGVGGIGSEPQDNGIARKLTWVGIGPHKAGDPRRPKVTFDHFLHYGKDGRLLREFAPKLAKHLYDGKARVIMDSLSDEERREVEVILDLARNAPPSGRLKGISHPISRNRRGKCRSHASRGKLSIQENEHETPPSAQSCYLCGQPILPDVQRTEDALSMDHVPPKQFYPKETRSTIRARLWYAPSHKRCNEDYREDEEYFYHVMHIVVQDNNPSMGQVLHMDLARRTHKPQTPAMLRNILKTFAPVTSGGIYLPPPLLRFEVDRYRAERVVLKIVRGLFFLDHGRHLPLENCKDIRLCLAKSDVPEIYARMWEAGPAKTICPEVFSYRHFEVKGLHLWSLLFWEAFMFCIAFQDPLCRKIWWEASHRGK